MKLACARSAGCNKGKLWLHDDSSVGKLSMSAPFHVTTRAPRRTEWLLLQDQEDRIHKLKVLGQVVELYRRVSCCSFYITVAKVGIDIRSIMLPEAQSIHHLHRWRRTDPVSRLLAPAAQQIVPARRQR